MIGRSVSVDLKTFLRARWVRVSVTVCVGNLPLCIVYPYTQGTSHTFEVWLVKLMFFWALSTFSVLAIASVYLS
jgi:hypothetical protein